MLLGWEWSQSGRVPAEHYGHKNVIFKGLGDEEFDAARFEAIGMRRPRSVEEYAIGDLTRWKKGHHRGLGEHAVVSPIAAGSSA